MNSYDGYITIGTAVDTSGIETGLNKINSSVNKSTQSLSNTVNKTFNLLKKSIIGAGVIFAVRQITKELGEAVSRFDVMQNYSKVMSNLGIQSKDAEASIKRLKEELSGLPTSIDAGALAVQRFASANKNVKASTEMFLAVNNAILAGGANMQIQKSALEQLSQAYAKGKPDMMEWRTMMMAFPAQLNQVAQVMGYGEAGASKLGEALRSGSVSMNEFMFTLIKMNKQGINGFKSLQEQAQNATGGISTAIYRLKNTFITGLTDIMDTIGRSNIVGFFDAIRNAIAKVIPYIQAFIKLILTAINYIAGLFGKKVKKQAESTTNSVSDLGASISSTADDMDNASGSASKLNKELKQLAGFDEMNVLSDTKSSGGGSGGGASGGAGGGIADLSDFDFDTSAFDDVNDELDKLYEKMLKWAKWFTEDINIEPLVKALKNLGDAIHYLNEGLNEGLYVFIRDFVKPLATYVINDWLPRFLNATADAIQRIDFTGITKAFSNLWKALEPFMENVGDGLLWFYENVLIPIGLWAVNTALPIIVNDIAKAFEFLNAVIDKVSPVFSWLYDNVLKPLADWAGDKIAEMLKEIGESLELMAKNEGVQLMLKGVVILFGNLLAIIILVSGAIAKFIKALFDVGQEAGKTVDKIIEFFSGIPSWIDEHVVKPIKKLFAPLIDFFKSVFGPIGENIKIVFNNIGEFAKFSWNTIKSVFTPVVNFFGKLFTSAKDGIIKAFSPVLDFITGLWNAIKSRLTEWGGKIGEAVSGAFKGAVNGVLRAIESILNTPIRAINGLIDAVNKIPGVSMTRLKTFNLPRLAKGGIVNLPGRGVPIGGAITGERGKEGVIPLTDSQQMALLGEAIGKYITVNANITNTMNGRVISRELQKINNESDFAFNR